MFKHISYLWSLNTWRFYVCNEVICDTTKINNYIGCEGVCPWLMPGLIEKVHYRNKLLGFNKSFFLSLFPSLLAVLLLDWYHVSVVVLVYRSVSLPSCMCQVILIIKLIIHCLAICVEQSLVRYQWQKLFTLFIPLCSSDGISIALAVKLSEQKCTFSVLILLWSLHDT